jgi:hypothetical protein
MFMVVLPPTATLPATNALLTVGAPNTVSVAVAAVPLNATGPVAVGALVVFTLVLVALTLCVIAQLPPTRIEPVLNPTLVPPFVPPVSAALLPTEHVTDPTALLTSVPPYVSLMTTPVMVPSVLALLTVITIELLPPLAIVAGVNVLVTVGGAYTFSVALAVVPAAAFVLVTGPVLLFFAPAVVPVTTTL